MAGDIPSFGDLVDKAEGRNEDAARLDKLEQRIKDLEQKYEAHADGMWAHHKH